MTVQLEITEGPVTQLDEYVTVPIAFEVRTILALEVPEQGLGGFHLVERAVEAPYVKDYDALESPLRWPERFDLSRWRAFTACRDGARVGGLVLAFDTPGLHHLEGRRDCAAVWDLRVSPVLRGHGVGSRLLAAAETWARARGIDTLTIETQNVNLGACRFYARRGCVLAEIRRFTYPALPHEIELRWVKTLGPRPE
ncbi:MAG: GNAT family N-acetyltransferase [Myxococcales bacterium]|nr:GNAT family N-acetyltransferase [Myxococcales bacterium]